MYTASMHILLKITVFVLIFMKDPALSIFNLKDHYNLFSVSYWDILYGHIVHARELNHRHLEDGVLLKDSAIPDV